MKWRLPIAKFYVNWAFVKTPTSVVRHSASWPFSVQSNGKPLNFSPRNIRITWNQPHRTANYFKGNGEFFCGKCDSRFHANVMPATSVSTLDLGIPLWGIHRIVPPRALRCILLLLAKMSFFQLLHHVCSFPESFVKSMRFVYHLAFVSFYNVKSCEKKNELFEDSPQQADQWRPN